MQKFEARAGISQIHLR